ncbi:triphosphoribosyl-dephospho-CoA synthase [Sphaerisporangium sp. NPDC005288]|uniref:triphosphoribosyl-dephospho-CoA synthase n=1 Tax=Sphaerisporangium sp. NPDC005288 TaxID=3155114 RepID=UPI0033BD7A6F
MSTTHERSPARAPRPSADMLADLAVRALCEEAWLSPKPGLVDGRGAGAHGDMDLALLLASAEALRPAFRSLADAARRTATGGGPRGELGLREELQPRRGLGPRDEYDPRRLLALREELGRIGRAGEAAMSRVTGGVNTHRGALWTLGLLVAATAVGTATDREAARVAARLASLPDRNVPAGAISHGERARRRYGASGARGQAVAAFPHVIDVALPRLRLAGAAGLRQDAARQDAARLDALLAVMSLLEDTCVLHRGGLDGLRVVRSGAGRVLAEGGAGTRRGRAALLELDERLTARRLSPGGSADLLAAALFLDIVPWPSPDACPNAEPHDAWRSTELNDAWRSTEPQDVCPRAGSPGSRKAPACES